MGHVTKTLAVTDASADYSVSLVKANQGKVPALPNALTSAVRQTVCGQFVSLLHVVSTKLHFLQSKLSFRQSRLQLFALSEWLPGNGTTAKTKAAPCSDAGLVSGFRRGNVSAEFSQREQK